MTCAACLELISARLDGELSAPENAALDLHLQECPACARLAERMAQQDSQLRSLPELPAPPLRRGSGRRSAGPASALLLLAASLTLFLGMRALHRERLVQLFVHADGLKSEASEQQPLAATTFVSPPLQGRLQAQRGADFQLFLDSGAQANSDIRLQVEYDYEGDGRVDRVETYRPLQTDSHPGWQSFDPSLGLESVQGPPGTFRNGTVALRILHAGSTLKIESGRSWLRLPLG